ncbi:MAG: hypothetical protein LBB76_06430 [Azoarcus sp.]|nr:hypothetical protein [Azoarcus sp.]
MVETIQGDSAAATPRREMKRTILARVAVALLGSYAVAWFAAAAIACAVADGFQGKTLGQMIGPLVYATAVIWAFAVRRLRVAVGGIALSALAVMLLWLMLGGAR